VASLFGRFIRTAFVLFVACAILATTPLAAAPFAAIVMDARTGEVLYERNADTRLHPASLTKMMTLYIAFQELEAGRITLDTMVTVSRYAAAQPPSRLGLKPGQRIALRHLIRASALKSANDAAAAIGDAISGDNQAFAKRMTRTARQLGMDSTTFRNAHGLTAEGHLSTARDMNVLGRHLFYDFPQYYNLFSRRTADAGMATVRNTNTRFLDAYEGADGIKTGFTSAAGFNLTASALRGNKRIIATVFGGTSTANRNARMKELMDVGFAAARNRVREQPPVAPGILPEDALPADALIAAASPNIDEVGAEGGAGKTVRVRGGVTVSLRPKARPRAPAVPAEVAIAMAAGVADALAEATAPPPPEGTLDFQAATIAAGGPPPATPAPAEAPAAVALAAAPAPDPAGLPEGTLEAQAASLAAAEAQKPRPVPRPETALAAAAPAPGDGLAGAAPEIVLTDPGQTAASAPTTLASGILAGVTAVEAVSAAATMAPPAANLAAGLAVATAPMPERQAPIFDAAAPIMAPPAPEPEVVVVMSTAGGRNFGVNVGEFASRHDAERALLRTALAESATLDEGLRKTSQSAGSWHASFMGLTLEQAELACRRLRARAVPCETVGN